MPKPARAYPAEARIHTTPQATAEISSEWKWLTTHNPLVSHYPFTHLLLRQLLKILARFSPYHIYTVSVLAYGGMHLG